MPSNDGAGTAFGERSAFEILIVGGCYAGLAAAVNLLDLCHGQLCRFAPRSPADATIPPNRKVPVHITIVDERDGYCEFFLGNCYYGIPTPHSPSR